MASNMTQRVVFAGTAIPAAGVAIWYGGWALAGLVVLLGVLGTRELLALGREHGGIRAHRFLAGVSAAALPLLVWRMIAAPAAAARLAAAAPYALALWLLVVLLWTLWRVPVSGRPLSATALTVLAPLYTAGLPSFLLLLRHGAGHGERSWAGTALAFFPLAVTWACDTAAMEVGRRVGGPKLAPALSPGKTWSGTIAGALAALAIAPLYQVLVLARVGLTVTPWQALAVGAAIGVLGQLGDLVESLFKREAGVKDSSRLLPGHGGILDRLDSLYFAIPLAATLLALFGLV